MIWRRHNSSAWCPPREVDGHYDRLVQCGTLRGDAHQKYVVQQLAQLQHTMKTYSNHMYLSLLASTLTRSNDDKSRPTLDEDPHVIPAENKGDGSVNKVTKYSSSLECMRHKSQVSCPISFII